jgi:Flp pilus assembly secretin CpaC
MNSESLMRRTFSIVCLATVSALASGTWRQARADGSFDIAHPPGHSAPGVAEMRVVPAGDRPREYESGADNTQIRNGVTMAIPPVQQLLLPTGTQRHVIFDRPYSELHISSPDVIEATAITDHALLIRGDKAGSSEIYLYGKDGKLQNILAVNVDDYNYTLRSPLLDPEAQSYNAVEIHNKARLDSQTNYRCGPDGCHYVGELTVSEPAPLPRGYTSNNSNANINYTGIPAGSGGPPASPPSPGK